MIKLKFPDYYDKFVCVADKCEKTCCAAWQVVIDSESEKRYKSEKSEIGKKLRSAMYFDGEDTVFKLENGRCPFLEKDGLCEIYSALGKKSLCRTCEKYPRFETDFGGRRELGLSVSCPTAARLILLSDSFTEYLTRDTDAPPTPNTTDPQLYFSVMKARQHIIDIIRQSEAIDEALNEIIEFTQKFQGFINDEDVFEKTESLTVKKLRVKKREYSGECLKLLLDMERLDERAGELILSALGKTPDFSIQQQLLRRFFEYYVYRYFSSAVFDKDALTPINLAVFAVCCVATLLSENASEDETVDICVIFSREVEHSQFNMSKLKAK